MVEEPFLHKGTGKLYVKFEVIDNLLINDAIHIEKVDAGIIVFEFDLLLTLKEFDQKGAMGFFIGFADNVQNIGIG
jgi:hypothetical protein